MNKRHKETDPQGHTEKQSAVPAFIWCPGCGDCRLKSHEWRRPCPESGKTRGQKPYMGE